MNLNRNLGFKFEGLYLFFFILLIDIKVISDILPIAAHYSNKALETG